MLGPMYHHDHLYFRFRYRFADWLRILGTRTGRLPIRVRCHRSALKRIQTRFLCHRSAAIHSLQCFRLLALPLQGHKCGDPAHFNVRGEKRSLDCDRPVSFLGVRDQPPSGGRKMGRRCRIVPGGLRDQFADRPKAQDRTGEEIGCSAQGATIAALLSILVAAAVAVIADLMTPTRFI